MKHEEDKSPRDFEEEGVECLHKPVAHILVEIDSKRVRISRMWGGSQLNGIDKASGELQHDPTLNCWLDVMYDGADIPQAIEPIRCAMQGRLVGA